MIQNNKTQEGDFIFLKRVTKKRNFTEMKILLFQFKSSSGKSDLFNRNRGLSTQ